MKKRNNDNKRQKRTTVNRVGPGSASFSGIMLALITPFRKDGKLKLDVLPSFIQFLLQSGCNGFLWAAAPVRGFSRG